MLDSGILAQVGELIKINAKELKLKKAETKPSTGRKSKPMLSVRLPEKTKKVSLNLKESNAQLLEDYRAFLSAHLGTEVTLDAVADAVIEKLGNDRSYKDWKKSR